jgi:hypothetical protein
MHTAYKDLKKIASRHSLEKKKEIGKGTQYYSRDVKITFCIINLDSE